MIVIFHTFFAFRIRDRTNEQTLAFQAYQSQLQAQYLQQQQQQQSNQPTSQGMQINNDAALQVW